MDIRRLADEPVLFTIDEPGVKGPGDEAMGGDSLPADGLDEADVLFGEGLSSSIENRLVGDSEPIERFGFDSTFIEGLVELRASTVEDDRRQSDGVEEGECSSRLLEAITEDGPADLDHSEPGAIELGEPAEVGADLLAVAHVRQEMDDCLPDIPIRCHRSARLDQSLHDGLLDM